METVMKLVLASLAAILATSSVALAGTPWINARQHHQQVRIAKGIVTCALTPHEIVKLERGQLGVQVLKGFARATGGAVTPFERLVILKAQNKQSARIHAQKHDGQHC
jgi:hypothetical protein